MRVGFLVAAVAALAALSIPAADAAAQRRAAVMRDWTRIVVRTPEGGYRMGNPAAPVKLVEYGSISCPHCAAFNAAAAAPLRDQYVRSGRVSWEYRPYLIFPTDPGVFLLLGCAGPQNYFRLMDRLYAAQAEWMGRVQNAPQDALDGAGALAPADRAAALARLTGLDGWFRQQGMAPARVDQCLADRPALQQLAQVTRRGTSEGVTGTPTFFVNGVKQRAGGWAQLEPALRAH
jgi:protein-disulfide isomerase